MSGPTQKQTSISNTNRPPLTTTADLARDYAYIVEKIDELERLCAALPLVIEDDEDQAIVAKMLPRLTGAASEHEKLRKAEKEPYLEAGRVVDGWFGEQHKRLQALATHVRRSLDAYVQKKAEAERRRHEEAERKAREEADRQRKAAEQAETAGNPHDEAAAREAAAEAENEAREAAASAAARAADLVRTHTESGQTVSAREIWVAKIVDLSKVDLNAIREHVSDYEIERAVNRAVAAGVRKIPGVLIEKVVRAIVR